jgi:CDP-glucose 4,6-dehydratase
VGIGLPTVGAPVSAYWSERRVLVTGATGIVGSWLCEELVRLDAAVVALVRDDDPQSMFYSGGVLPHVTVVRGALQNLEDCTRAIIANDIEVVFHLGAQTLVGPAVRDPLETFESNIRGTYNLLEAARRAPDLVKAFVVASSDKAYGDSAILPYTEEMPLNGRHPYDVSKSCTDLLASTYHDTYETPVAIARCGNIYGAGDLNWSRIVPGTIRSFLRGEQPILRSNGSNIRDYIYVRDVVSAYLALAEQIVRPEIAGEAFNFSPESRITVLEIVQAIARLMNTSIEPIVLGTAVHEIQDQTLSAAKAQRLLDWQAQWTLEEGLTETIDWYRHHLATKAGISRASHAGE